MNCIQFKLNNPPPSLNGSKKPIIRGGKIYMVSTPEYVAWQNDATAQIISQKQYILDGYWRSDILIPAGKTKADIDNLVKAIHDILIKNKRVPDDKYLVDLRVRLYPGAKVVVTIKPEEYKKWEYLKRISKSALKKLAKRLPFQQMS